MAERTARVEADLGTWANPSRDADPALLILRSRRRDPCAERVAIEIERRWSPAELAAISERQGDALLASSMPCSMASASRANSASGPSRSPPPSYAGSLAMASVSGRFEPDEGAVAALAGRPAASDGLVVALLRARRSPLLAARADERTPAAPANPLEDLSEEGRRLLREAIDEVLDAARHDGPIMALTSGGGPAGALTRSARLVLVTLRSAPERGPRESHPVRYGLFVPG